MSFKMTQSQYTSLYGPTVGDSVRLGDTNYLHKLKKIMPIMVMKRHLVAVNLSVMAWHKTQTSLEMIAKWLI